MAELKQKTIDLLERKFKESMIEDMYKLGLKRLPLLPSDHTLRMMAKAEAVELLTIPQRKICEEIAKPVPLRNNKGEK